MRAAIYTRISNDREGREVGVNNQETACRDRAKDWTVTEVYTDNDTGASSKSRKPRPNYDRLLADAKAGRFDVLVCYSTSRLTRRPLELEAWLPMAEAGKLKAVFLTGPAADWTSIHGRAVARTLAAWDAAEAETIGERLAFRFKGDAYKGKRHGGPIGFGWTPEQAEAVKGATERVIRREVSILGLTREWTEAGFKPQRGGIWHTYAVRRILMRPANAGLAVYKGEIITDDDGNQVMGDWEPIISVDDHLAVCQVLNNPDRKTMTTNKTRCLTTNLAKCGKCGHSMRNASAGTPQKRYQVYRCSNTGSCGGNSISQKATDNAVTNAVVYDYFRNPEAGHEPGEIDRQITELRARQGEISKAREDVMSLVTDRDVPFTAVQAKPELTKLGKEDAQIETEISRLIANNAHHAMVSQARDDLFSRGHASELSRGGRRVLTDLFGRFDGMPLADRRRLISDRFTITINPSVKGQSAASRVEIRQRSTGELFELIPGKALDVSEDDWNAYIDREEARFRSLTDRSSTPSSERPPRHRSQFRGVRAAE